MAPIANNNNNSNIRQTGTVPKTKTSRKNSVPQEMVVPTRRDLQQHFELVGWTSSGHHGVGVPTNYSKSQNNRTPGEGASFDIDNLTLHEHSSRFIPVRPIVRRNLLHEEMNESTSSPSSSAAANNNNNNQNNTAIGIVIPTQPLQTTAQNLQSTTADGFTSFSMPIRTPRDLQSQNSNTSQQQHQQSQQQQRGLSGQQSSTSSLSQQQSNLQNYSLPPRAGVEEKLNQIQEYIKITSSLLNSMQLDDDNRESYGRLETSLTNLKDSEVKLKRILETQYQPTIINSEKMSSETDSVCSDATMVDVRSISQHSDDFEQDHGNAISSAHLENVDQESVYGRAQSVSSINTNSVPNTPTYEELRVKHDHQLRNMQNIKEQQNQLQCLQNLAKQQLFELEKVRDMQAEKSYAHIGANGLPNYETVEQVQGDVSNLMNRMQALTSFIQNQNDLTTLLGDDGEDILNEQLTLQKKLLELRTKKQEMDSLVNELSTLNVQSDQQHHQQQQQLNDQHTRSPSRNIAGSEYQRIVPIELINNTNSTSSTSNATRFSDESEHDNLDKEVTSMLDSVGSVTGGNGQSVFGEKVAEINAMKDQLKRLKQMMQTVKLIEMKTGVTDDEEDGDEEDDAVDGDDEDDNDKIMNGEMFIHPTHDQQHGGGGDKVTNNLQPSNNANTVQVGGGAGGSDRETAAEREENQQKINQRVLELQSMSQDLRQQALSLAAQRDQLRTTRDSMFEKCEKYGPAKKNNQSDTKSQPQLLNRQRSTTPKKDYEKYLKSIEKEDDRETVKSGSQQRHNHHQSTSGSGGDGFMYYHDNWGSQADSQSASVNSDGRLVLGKLKIGGTNGTGLLSTAPGNDSADSGAADLISGNVDVRSLQSGSTRSLSMPPPMPNLSERTNNWHHKSSHDSHRLTSQQNCCARGGHCSPWLQSHGHNVHGVGSSSAADCTSPMCYNYSQSNPAGDHYHNCCGGGGGGSSVNPFNYTPQLPSDNPMYQEFLQTQQMLVNTICKCNELLWSQQKEINTLNNAVLWLQEKFLTQNIGQNLENGTPQPIGLRAESVPPLIPTNIPISHSGTPYYGRAQSEQPLIFPSNTASGGVSVTPVRSSNTNASTYQPSYNMLRNQQQNNQRSLSNVQQSLNMYQQHQQNGGDLVTQRPPIYPNYNVTSVPIAPTNNPDLLTQQNATPLNNNISQQQHQQHNHDQGTPIFVHHINNINTAASSPAPASNNNSKLLHQAHNLLTSQANVAGGGGGSPAVANNAFNPSGPSALNNQVPPGNRANNYWDNFRSYSRQNLLSNNSCKSNDGSGLGVNNGVSGGGGGNFLGSIGNAQISTQSSTSNNYHNQQQSHQHHQQQNLNIDRMATTTVRNQQHQQQQQQQLPSSTMTYNNLPNHFRNQLNQLSISQTTPAPPTTTAVGGQGQQQQQIAINLAAAHQQQQHQQHHQYHQQQQGGNDSLNENLVTNNFNNITTTNLDTSSSINLCDGGGGGDGDASTDTSYMSSILQFHTNPINLGVYEFSTKYKSLPKVYDNNNKKILRQHVRPFDANNLYYNQENNQLNSSSDTEDLNLMRRSTSSQHNNNSNTNNNNNFKSTPKMFEALKDNVYQEVSALIAANENRPHFLIQLFRDLQLISSDPLRQRTLQSIQELYNRYNSKLNDEDIANVEVCSNNGAGGSSGGGGNTASETNQQASTLSNPPENGGAENINQNFNVLDLHHQQHNQQSHFNIIHVILQDITTFLQSVDAITEMAFQKIISITLAHLNQHPSNILKTNTMVNLNYDDFFKNLNNFNRFSKEEFLLNFENYLKMLLLKSGNVASGRDPAQYAASSNSSTANIHPIESNNQNPCNEDLAEADQICSNENSYLNDGDGLEEGAIGGGTTSAFTVALQNLSGLSHTAINLEVTNSNDPENQNTIISSLDDSITNNEQIINNDNGDGAAVSGAGVSGDGGVVTQPMGGGGNDGPGNSKFSKNP